MTTLEADLRDLVAVVLAIRPADVDLHRPLSALGLDSLAVVDLQARLAERHSLDLDPAAFFEDITLADLAQQIGTVAQNHRAALQRAPGVGFRRSPASPLSLGPTTTMHFSLFYFSAIANEPTDNRYRLLLEGARFADRNGFTAVWLPERHFHPFGGLYPNPSVLAAALATSTRRVRLRAGSVVLPLHNPMRVAEEWAVVDNLSGGRVDLAFASGWNPDDFALAPSAFAERGAPLGPMVETVRRLWRGEALPVANGLGHSVALRTYPRPCQPDLPVWITCTGGRERFAEAGSLGANVLTALLFQSVDQLGERIAEYREARERHGFDPATGHVTVMLHTFVGSDEESVRRTIRAPLLNYLASSVDLWRRGAPLLETLSADERERVLDYAFERYVCSSALIGTPTTCHPMVSALAQIGVDEIAALIDFGVDEDTVLDSLASLRTLKDLERSPGSPLPLGEGQGEGVPGGAKQAPAQDRRDTSVATEAPHARLTQPNLTRLEPYHSTRVAVARLRADARLSPDFPRRVTAPARPQRPRHILLTGATGFLGAALLRGLLDATEATIHCLVRAPDRDTAASRLREVLERYSLWNPESGGRIVALPGDLATPGLGLPPADLGALAESIDTIYHNAAAVSFVARYDALRPINVGGTAEVLRLAVSARIKTLHYVSTASVFDSPRYAGRVVDELDPPDDARDLTIGYAQSKWVAERLVRTASERGLPVAIYRPAWVSGDSQTGAGNDEDFLSRLVASCVRLGAAPQLDYAWNLVPVDYVSRAIVHLSLEPDAVGRAFHLANPAPLPWARLAELIGRAGYQLGQVAYSRWRARLLAGSNDHPDGLRPLADLFVPGRRRDVPALYQSGRLPTFDGSRTAELLARIGIACPPADARLIRAYLTHWRRVGLLPEP